MPVRKTPRKTQSYRDAEHDANRSWKEKTFERNAMESSKRLRNVLIISVFLAVIIILTGVNAFIRPIIGEESPQTQYASDNYAASSADMSVMEDRASAFATGIVVSAYTSDDDTAKQALQTSLSYIPNTTQTYQKTSERVIGNGPIPAGDLKVEIGDIDMSGGSRMYNGYYTCKLHATAVNTAENVYEDDGVDFTLYFQEVVAVGDDGSETRQWMIVDYRISE